MNLGSMQISLSHDKKVVSKMLLNLKIREKIFEKLQTTFLTWTM